MFAEPERLLIFILTGLPVFGFHLQRKVNRENDLEIVLMHLTGQARVATINGISQVRLSLDGLILLQVNYQPCLIRLQEVAQSRPLAKCLAVNI